MNAAQLKRKLKSYTSLPEELNIRLHRSISWLACAEKYAEDVDLYFLNQWIAFNACYALDMNLQEQKTEREKFRQFIQTLVKHDDEQRIFNILWEKFSGPIRILIQNQYIFRTFWDYQRGEIADWKKAFEKSNEEASKHLAKKNVAGLLEILLDRLYILRNQLMHGGSTYNSKINRRQVRDGAKILEMLIPILIDIMMQHPEDDWGKLLFPLIKE